MHGAQRFTLVLFGHRISPRLSPQLPVLLRVPTAPAPDTRRPAVGRSFVPTKVLPAALGEPVDEKRQFAPPKRHDGAEPAGPAAALEGDAPLDHPATQIGVDQAGPGAIHSLAQRGIVDSLATGEPGERLGLERPQFRSRRSLSAVYNTKCGSLSSPSRCLPESLYRAAADMTSASTAIMRCPSGIRTAVNTTAVTACRPCTAERRVSAVSGVAVGAPEGAAGRRSR